MSEAKSIIYQVSILLEKYPKFNLLDRSVFLSNLTFLYHCMRASEHLLEVAADNSIGDVLHEYFVDHLEEERGHEKWLAEDLATAGIDVANTLVNREVVEMVGSQYYLVHHMDPAALLGYMLLMECNPMPLSTVELLEIEHGTKLLRTLRYHAEHDVDHGAELLNVIDSLPADRQLLVRQAAIQSAIYFANASTKFA